MAARRLAHYGAKLAPAGERIKALLSRRQQWVAERVRSPTRLDREKSSRIEDSRFRHRDWLDREIEQRERQYQELPPILSGDCGNGASRARGLWWRRCGSCYCIGRLARRGRPWVAQAIPE